MNKIIKKKIHGWMDEGVGAWVYGWLAGWVLDG